MKITFEGFFPTGGEGEKRLSECDRIMFMDVIQS